MIYGEVMTNLWLKTCEQSQVNKHLAMLPKDQCIDHLINIIDEVSIIGTQIKSGNTEFGANLGEIENIEKWHLQFWCVI